jgi:hypothetical protein
MVAVTVCFNCQSRVLQFKIVIAVTWLYIVYDYGYRLVTPSEMGMGFIIVWFHCNLIIKLIRGMEYGTVFVSVFDLRK